MDDDYDTRGGARRNENLSRAEQPPWGNDPPGLLSCLPNRELSDTAQHSGGVPNFRFQRPIRSESVQMRDTVQSRLLAIPKRHICPQMRP